MGDKLTHLDADGQAQMVDVSQKQETVRVATATAQIHMLASTLSLILEGGHKKGDVLAVARVAGIQGAKKTPDLIPLCHPLMLSKVNIDFTHAFIENASLPKEGEQAVLSVSCTCKLKGQTGVEMEALTGASVAALTVYDMCKAVQKDIVIGAVQLETKSGGKSGDFNRQAMSENC